MKKLVVSIVVVAAVAGLTAWNMGQPDAVVEVVRPRAGTIRAYVEEHAKTELPHDYLIAMPISGWLEPIALREGDPVGKGQVVAKLDTADLSDRARQAEQRIAVLETKIEQTNDHRLEKHALVETEATVKAIDETVRAAEAKLEATLAVMEFAKSEVDRVKQFRQAEAGIDREYREVETEYRKAGAEYQSDKLELAALKTLAAVSYIGPKFITDYIDRKSFDVTSYAKELEQAKADLDIERRNLARAEINSPIDGVVLARHQTRRQFLAAGTPLLTVGRLDDMEVIAEVLTERAVMIDAGDPVEISGRGIPGGPIEGKVWRVYPSGFKKISSLGVEQQRVKVAIELARRPEKLGVEFRVRVRIFHDRADEALLLPRTALFRSKAGDWQAMAIEEGYTKARTLRIGITNDDDAQILEGLSADDQVIAYPSREIVGGMRVETSGGP